jgi:hypothetical protein
MGTEHGGPSWWVVACFLCLYLLGRPLLQQLEQWPDDDDNDDEVLSSDLTEKEMKSRTYAIVRSHYYRENI